MFYISKDISGLLKLFSALLVMATHYLRMKALAGHELNWLEWAVRSQGNVAVAIFFFLSGYGLMSSEMRRHLALPQFVRKRFCKVYLPVVAVTALWLPVAYGIYGTPGSVAEILKHLLWDFCDPVMWFVKNLLVLYAGFGIFACLLYSGRRKPAFAALCAALVATAVQSYWCNGQFWLNSLSGIPLFAVGVVAALYADRCCRGVHVAFVPLALGFVSVAAVMSFYPRFLPNVSHVLADYLCVGAVLVVFSRWRPAVKVPLALSMLTFDLYLLHFKVLVMMTRDGEAVSLPMYFAVALAVAAVFGVLRAKTSALVERRASGRVFENS